MKDPQTETRLLDLLNQRNRELAQVRIDNPQAKGNRLLWLRKPIVERYKAEIEALSQTLNNETPQDNDN